jgi:hypothetical protein
MYLSYNIDQIHQLLNESKKWLSLCMSSNIKKHVKTQGNNWHRKYHYINNLKSL